MGLAELLLEWADRVERPEFVAQDPLLLPRRFAEDPPSAEIAGFRAATVAWGSRASIISSAERALAALAAAPAPLLPAACAAAAAHAPLAAWCGRLVPPAARALRRAARASARSMRV